MRAKGYKYDEENRVVEIRKTSSTGPLLLQFTYDALGRRVQTTEYIDPQSGASWDGLGGRPSPRTTRHIYSGLEPIQEYICGGPGAPACDGSYTLAREFVWGDSARFPEPVAMVDYTGANGVSGCGAGTPPVGCAYHYLRDALGSVTGLTDSTGHLVERYTCDPYGKTLIERYDPSANGGAGAWIATNASSFGNPWMWTGHRYDAAVGLYHTLFRHYSPQLGRWLQRDPIGYAGGSVNLYEYAVSAPLFWIDPYGLDLITFSSIQGLTSSPIGGHHWVPQAVRRNHLDDLSPEADGVLKKNTSGPLDDHGWTKEHLEYNDEVDKELQKFKKKKGISKARKMNEAEAKEFVETIRDRCGNEKIKRFNEAIKKSVIKTEKEVAEKTEETVVKKVVKRVRKRVGKGIASKIVPFIGVGFFAYDWYQGGLGHAVNEATWPVSEIWVD
ncbi:MAG: RHS repeat-associated core domain-containing protein [Planctomycetes bacterium]|nr:RHS repeat-associated core domain-containing protein [Planctomycetota bacterium]